MDNQLINLIANTTQQARRLLEKEFSEQFEGLYDLRPEGGLPDQPGSHLDARGGLVRQKLYAVVQHKMAQGLPQDQAVADALREAAFTSLNRFAALKMLEARGLMSECVSKGDQSAGFREFCGLAPSLPLLPDAYATYLACVFDELAVEVKVLFDRQDPSGLIWPRRPALVELVNLLNTPELTPAWGEDETIGWIYQYFNSQDERRQMRAESGAPRNSREMAVRNQFFTPRYVVKFLVDYTLGELANLEPMDPRDLKVLDPACGSGHFLLYAFEVLEGIYRTAWEKMTTPASNLTGKTLREDYPEWESLQREIPSLILACNVHGVDIDPRCAQIAALSLWMRAQKAYQVIGLSASERPFIRKVHVAVAEPMPGERDYLRAFLDQYFSVDAEARVLAGLIEVAFNAMHLAGEMGSLLKVEDTIRAAIHQARSASSGDVQQMSHLSLFAPTQQSVQLTLDLKQVTDESFWDQAETRIYTELKTFAEQAAQDQGYQRQLFADDAEQGFALIDILRKTYDVVLMNPPFGECTTGAKSEFQRLYPRTKNDLYAAFVERGIQLLRKGGRLGAITSRTGFFLTSYKQWREEILLGEARPLIVADLGHGVLDAMVETAAYTLEKHNLSANTLFLRLTAESDKPKALEASLVERSNSNRFSVDLNSLKIIPGTPFAYWASESFLKVFDRFDRFESPNLKVRQGGVTGNDDKYLRAWWEANPLNFIDSDVQWVPFAKGGKFSAYFSDVPIVVKWHHSRSTYFSFTGLPHRPSEKPSSSDYYFRGGLTWPLRAHKFGPAPLPRNAVFSIRGYAIISDNNEKLLPLMALCNSFVFDYIFKLTLGRFGFPEFVVGVLQNLPLPSLEEIPEEQHSQLAHFAQSIWSKKQKRGQVEETSHVFLLPAVLMAEGCTIADRALAWDRQLKADDAEIEEIQTEIDKRCWNLYGLEETDRKIMMDSSLAVSEPTGDGNEPEGNEDGDEEMVSVTPKTLVEDFASWLFGAALGRWDWGLATGDTLIPPLPGPFDPLPNVSRGMVRGSDHFHPARFEDGRLWPPHDLLVDDDGASLDLVHRALEILERVVGKEHIEAFALELQQMLGSDLRTWFRSSFFERHLKRYSKSRRKAPIYWQLGTPSASYSVWLYYPRLTRDSLYRVLNEVVKPKVTYEEQRLTEMRGEGVPRRQIEIQEGFVEELRTFREEVTRVAPLWNPDLDDGVLLNFAPLWRLTPHPGWRKDTKAAWDALAKGDYDWARLAMKLWPERVIPKCARERHLALAHDLEASLQATPVEELIRVGTSPAVKDALQSLLTAPALGGSARAPRSATPRRVTPTEEPAPAPTPRSRGTVSEETLAAIKEALVPFPQGAAKADVLEATNLTDTAWNTGIQVLLDRGEVERRGEKRGARYFLKTLER